ncbi:MAG TPA: FAD-dependent oxidoreductase [Mycobacteriales bacterium]|nr:FAD-dependent oxidoreductase [Mycobacteriales bacterium]
MDDSTGLTRRRALGLLAGATAATIVAACSHSSGGPAPVSSAAASTGGSPVPVASSATATAKASKAADWRSLRRKLHGSLSRPGSTGYDEARLLFDRRFDSVMPAAIARVASEADVAQCLSFAEHYRLPVRLRSGGHSYIGASTGPGLVIDLRSLTGLTVDSGAGTATIGAGAALVDVYNELAQHGVSIPAGSCPSVGLSGLTLGGGIGVVARRYGLTCDRLTEARVVTADGTTLTCNATSHSDLYWALRGGGGSFGVVTSMTLGTHAADPLAHAFVAWPWSAAAQVVTAWQPWATAAPHSLWSSAHVLATDGTGSATISVAAVMVAGSSALQQQIGKLVQNIPTAPTTNFVGSASYESTMMLESGCSTLSVQACHVAAETPGGTLPRDAFVAGSDFFTDPIPAAGVNALVAAVAKRQSDPRLGAGGASLDILGGAVDDLAADATAWVHRGSLFDAQYTASWGTTPGNGPLARNQHSLASIHGTLRPYASGGAYQNYADDTLPNPQKSYYGANLARLIDVRRTYDPNRVFTQLQGVPLS